MVLLDVYSMNGWSVYCGWLIKIKITKLEYYDVIQTWIILLTINIIDNHLILILNSVDNNSFIYGFHEAN